MNYFKEKYGPWALITGASAGIGEEFARQLAAKGLNLVLTARRKDRLDNLCKELESQYNIQTKSVPVDLADLEFMSTIRHETRDIEIGILINNAGFGIGQPFFKSDLNKQLAQLNVHCRSHLIMTHEFGKMMIERGKGGIIWVSSVMAFFAAPYSTHYSATKIYDHYMAQGMYTDLKEHGVDSISLCPGFTITEFHDVSGTERIGGQETTPVVSKALRKLGKKSVVVTGFINILMVFGLKYIPQPIILFIWNTLSKKLKKR